MTTRVELQHEDTLSRVKFVSENGIQLLSESTRSELAEAVAEIESRRQCRVVLFEAEGRTFIAGADIKELQALDPESAHRCARETHELYNRIETLPAVTVAAIHGACAGGGFELALCCDLRLAAESAKIGLPEVSLGLIPGWGGTVRAARQFGPAVARRMILTGELFPAAEAQRLGIVHDVHPDETFPDAVANQVATIAKRSPSAVRTAKRLLQEFLQQSNDAAFAAEADAFAACFESVESQEGIAAFLEKRTPQW